MHNRTSRDQSFCKPGNFVHYRAMVEQCRFGSCRHSPAVNIVGGGWLIFQGSNVLSLCNIMSSGVKMDLYWPISSYLVEYQEFDGAGGSGLPNPAMYSTKHFWHVRVTQVLHHPPESLLQIIPECNWCISECLELYISCEQRYCSASMDFNAAVYTPCCFAIIKILVGWTSHLLPSVHILVFHT